jgi:DNA-directed RNA polymerase II subunit RPB1
MSGNTMRTKENANIIGIQFSILSPEEIRKMSVAEITSRDTYVNNRPSINGLFDPRMGVLDPGYICPTDGHNYMKTPGYFGHIELARPVFYIQYLKEVVKLLRCFCWKCSKLLCSKEKHKAVIETLSGDERWAYVFSQASSVKRCGDDTDNGCGCVQPSKVRKEDKSLAVLYAEWDNIEGADTESGKLSIKLTPEMVLKIFKRISNDDIAFCGFSPVFSRPEWMICQVLAVPPPAVRPSIKQDSQQRSEDDISHILVNIIKANKTLEDKIKSNAAEKVIDDWTTVLQYYVATQVDNKIPGVAAVAQRSGRPLKSIKERLNGKQGRVRGNLMGKRVDFSARSVITPDPNLSIRELGVPLKIAKNITKPVKVNKQNRDFLTRLIRNGPDMYPGAKILEKSNGENISLRYSDRESIVLKDGDTVHRHLLDGDYVLFNRQPTLHRMSMMCHEVKVLFQGDTFRMNVADTKPYNADFDGDEMNMHVPQDAEAEVELKDLVAVPHNLISPGQNSTIVGIFQDSLLGINRFTRPDIKFTKQQTMDLLMRFPKTDINTDPTFYMMNKDSYTNFDILSQIMPPLSLTNKNGVFDEDKENKKDSNNIIEIKNGQMLRGRLDKGTLGKTTKGLLHRICNDYGNRAASDFIDVMQNIVTDYMKTSAYSVGISDLVANKQTNEAIVEKITEKKRNVIDIISNTRLGVFENKTGKSNNEEFETKVNSILNEAAAEAGKIGRKNLEEDNRFVIMVNAGSKGSDLNISQMISCVGQQNVDGKRIPYGFDNRTLPHFKKFDDTPGARGFVENSFISGLTPEEVFFHAQGGRMGLIDTAVKTSQTGYVQRRLIKGLEDYKIEYDMTVRNHQRQIIQFSYGADNFDPMKVESQHLDLATMSVDEIYERFSIPKPTTGKNELYRTIFAEDIVSKAKSQHNDVQQNTNTIIKLMLEGQKELMEHVFRHTNKSQINCPVAFAQIINNVHGQLDIQSNSLVDITPTDAHYEIQKTFEALEKISKYIKPNKLFKILYNYYLSVNDLIFVKKFNRKGLIILLNNIELLYKKAIVSPGEMVGMIAAQSIGEPTTQMTLNTFHFAGVASKSNVTRGLPRVEEILSLSNNIKNPSLTLFLKDGDKFSRERSQRIMNLVEFTKIRDLVESYEICYDPDDSKTFIEADKKMIRQYKMYEELFDECSENATEKEKMKWLIRFTFDKEKMFEKNITMDDINFAIKKTHQDTVSCIYSDLNSDSLVFRIRITNVLQNKKTVKQFPLDQSDEIYLLNNFQNNLLDNVVIRGVKNISKVMLRKMPQHMHYEEDKYKPKDMWVLDTVGSNLIDALALDFTDTNKTITNNIMEIYRVLGIEAARQAIYNEFLEVIESDGGYINTHHLEMLADRMCCSYKPIAISRHGINNDDTGPIAKASFEETPEMFFRAAKHGELDMMRGVSANVMTGQEGYFGTSAFQTFLDIGEFKDLKSKSYESKTQDEEAIENIFAQYINPEDPCSIDNISVINNAANIKKTDLGVMDDDYDIDI